MPAAPSPPASRGLLLARVFPAMAGGALLLAASGCAGRLGGAARGPLPPPASATGADALVDQARRLSADQGLAEARSFLVEALAERDDSGGAMEDRLRRAAGDPDLVFPDSLAALTAAERAKVGIAFIPGMRAQQGNKPSQPVLAQRAAAREAAAQGFRTRVVPAVARGGVEDNAAAMSLALEELFAEVEHVIVVAKSKGAHDLVCYLREHGARLPPESRAKLKGACVFGGTVQGSFVADWFARHPDPWAAGTRLVLRLTGRGREIAMLRSVADSPWQDLPDGFPRSLYPRLTWISLAVLPDGGDGRPSESVWSPFFSRIIQNSSGWESPHDSLVETAAEVLPGGVDVPEWIVRVSGTHAFSQGTFLDGSPVTPLTPPLEDGNMNPEGGAEVMSAFLRSIPRSILD